MCETADPGPEGAADFVAMELRSWQRFSQHNANMESDEQGKDKQKSSEARPQNEMGAKGAFIMMSLALVFRDFR